MNIRQRAQQGRRPRRNNGDPRDNKPWSVKAVENHVKDRVGFLAMLLETTNAEIIDQSTKLLFQSLIQQDKESGRKGITLSHPFSNYASLLDDNEPSNDPAVLELEERLQKRKQARDVLMGRNCETGSHNSLDWFKDA